MFRYGWYLDVLVYVPEHELSGLFNYFVVHAVFDLLVFIDCEYDAEHVVYDSGQKLLEMLFLSFCIMNGLLE